MWETPHHWPAQRPGPDTVVSQPIQPRPPGPFPASIFTPKQTMLHQGATQTFSHRVSEVKERSLHPDTPDPDEVPLRSLSLGNPQPKSGPESLDPTSAGSPLRWSQQRCPGLDRRAERGRCEQWLEGSRSSLSLWTLRSYFNRRFFNAVVALCWSQVHVTQL